MKSVVYVFTGTGNSLQVAKEIAKGLPNCRLISMGKGSHNPQEAYDYIGFVYPTYAFNMPLRVKEFMTDMSLEKSKNAYYFAVTTCGNEPGAALSAPASILAKKGVTLAFAEKISMPANYVGLYKMSDENPKKYKEATAKIPALVNRIVEKTQRPPKKAKGFMNQATVLMQQCIFPKKDKGFHVSEACIECAVCQKVCPVNNISMESGKPVFHHNCEQCMACIQWCPTEAINYKNKTQDRGRYTNPSMKVNELIQLNDL